MNQVAPDDNTASSIQKRATALDALRGFAILMMVLSGTIRYKILPAWMYHAQEPPPTHDFNANLAGLTWVDLVFPLFLFSMGAAIPLAFSRRISKGLSNLQLITLILKRGFLLGSFAILLQHLRPHIINSQDSDMTKWWLGLLGFLLLFLMFVRWPYSGKLAKYTKWITVAAWLATAILVFSIKYPDANKPGFSLERSDIILIALTNMAVFGSLVWLFTRKKLLVRLGLLGLLLALRLSATNPSWIASFWSYSPVPWIFQFDYLKYLFIVIPGTIAGDLILDWLRSSQNNLEESLVNKWKSRKFYLILGLMFSICLILLIGLQSRLVWQTTMISAILCIFGWFLFKNPISPTEKLLNNFYKWGVYWLMLGLLFEPFGGGIKKDPSTMSYYFVTTGMAFLVLIIFTIVVNIFNKEKYLQLLIDNGQNPMIAYVAFANLIWPILNLTGLENVIINYTNSPLMGFIKGLISTLLIAYIVSFFTKKKLLWRT